MSCRNMTVNVNQCQSLSIVKCQQRKVEEPVITLPQVDCLEVPCGFSCLPKQLIEGLAQQRPLRFGPELIIKIRKVPKQVTGNTTTMDLIGNFGKKAMSSFFKHQKLALLRLKVLQIDNGTRLLHDSKHTHKNNDDVS